MINITGIHFISDAMMKIVDINLLIYAINLDTPHHLKAKKWLEDSLSSDEPFGFAWIVILGFLRIITNGRIMPAPLTSEVAIEFFEEWLQPPPSLTIVPSHQHRSILKELLSPLGTAANLTSDAHLAALAIEHGARLYSTDKIWNISKNVRNSDSMISII